MKNKKQTSHTLHGIREPGGSLLLLLIAFALPAAFGILLVALWFATFYTPFGLTGILLLLFPVSALPLFLPRRAETGPAYAGESDVTADPVTSPALSRHFCSFLAGRLHSEGRAGRRRS